jgi:hypothetical protein
MLTDTDIRNAISSLDTLESGDTDAYAFAQAVLVNTVESAFTRTRWVAADDAVGIMELADFFSIGRSTVTNWAAQRNSNGMPSPIKKLGAGPVYSLREIVEWWMNWKPIKGAKVGTLPSDY